MSKLKRGEGKHFPAILETGELIVPRDMAPTVEREHPSLKHGPTSVIPKIMDCGGVMDDGGVPMYPVAGTTGERLGQDLKGLGKRLGNADFSNVHNSADEPMLESVNMDQMPLYDRGGKVIQEYGPQDKEDYSRRGKARGERPEVNWEALDARNRAESQRSAEEGMRSAFTNLEGKDMRTPSIKLYDDGGTVETEQAPAQRELDQEQLLIDDARAQNTERKASALDKNDAVSLGHGLIADRVIDDHEDRHQARQEDTEGGGAQKPSAGTPMPKIEQPLYNGTTDANMRPMPATDQDQARVSTMPAVDQKLNEATSKVAGYPVQHDETAGLPKISDVAAPAPVSPELIPATPEKLQYTGPGKAVPAGELIPAKQLPTDEYKYRQGELDKRIEEQRDRAVDPNATPAERASAKTLADNLELRREELKKPGPTSKLGKVGQVLSRIGEAALLPTAPYMLQTFPNPYRDAQQRASTIAKIKQDVGQEKELAAAEAEKNKVVKSPWKAAVGEQYTQYDASGKPIRQLFTNDETGAQEWRDVPAAGAPTAGTPAAPAASAAAPAEGTYFGTKEAANRPIGEAGVNQAQAQVTSASSRLPKGYSIVPPTFSKDDTDTTRKDKLKDYETAVNNAVLADRSDKAQAARESAAETRERRAEERKDRNIPVYAENAEGQTILTNKYDAQLNGQAFEQVTPGDVAKDRSATRQLNDVQVNASRYTNSAHAYDAANLPEAKQKQDADNFAYLTNQAGFNDISGRLGEGSNITIPIITAYGEHLSTLKRSEQYKALSKEGKEMYDSYLRTMSAVPAYQKALTNIGRTNKEMMELELNNIAPPTYGTTDVIRKQGQFQENIDRAAAGFPKLPGLKTTAQTRHELEASKPTAPKPADVVRTGTLNNKTVYQLRDGRTVDAQGNEVR